MNPKSSQSEKQSTFEFIGRAFRYRNYRLFFGGTASFGSIMAGSLASRIGAPNTLIIGGIICIIGSFFFLKKHPLIRQAVRPLYIKMGIIREIPVELQRGLL